MKAWRVKFERVFDWTPPEDQRILMVFKPDGGPQKDGVYVVRQVCAKAAIAAGAAVDWRFNGADADKFDHDKKNGPGGAAVAQDAEA